MKVGILCEYSGVVRDAFIRRGHEAVSCDLLPTDVPGPHIQGDCLQQSWVGYDLLICHPPCTYLAVSGARWWKGREIVQAEAVKFVLALYDLPVPRVAIENPIGRLSSAWRKPDQIIQPWMFGHGETKATCLWLKGLSPLTPTNIVEGREGKVWKMSPGPDRWKKRSLTYQGIADAMASQWG